MNISGKIDALGKLKSQLQVLNTKTNEKKAEIKELEELLIAEMDKANLSKVSSGAATVSITSAVRPQVEDWDRFYAYIHRQKYYHLLDRRPSVLGCRELFETKGKIPGVIPFTQRKLSFTKIKK